jgi:hypothetical protein
MSVYRFQWLDILETQVRVDFYGVLKMVGKNTGRAKSDTFDVCEQKIFSFLRFVCCLCLLIFARKIMVWYCVVMKLSAIHFF